MPSLAYYESFLVKKPKFSSAFPQENKNFIKIDIENNNNLYNSELYPSFNNEYKKKNVINEKYNKIIARHEIFSQFPQSNSKENIYIGNNVKIGFSKK